METGEEPAWWGVLKEQTHLEQILLLLKTKETVNLGYITKHFNWIHCNALQTFKGAQSLIKPLKGRCSPLSPPAGRKRYLFIFLSNIIGSFTHLIFDFSISLLHFENCFLVLNTCNTPGLNMANTKQGELKEKYINEGIMSHQSSFI